MPSGRFPDQDGRAVVCGLWTILACPLFVCIKFYWNAATPVCFCTVRGHVPSAVAEVSSCCQNCTARQMQSTYCWLFGVHTGCLEATRASFLFRVFLQTGCEGPGSQEGQAGTGSPVQTAPAPGGWLPREMGRPQGMGGSPGEDTGAGAFPTDLHTRPSS